MSDDFVRGGICDGLRYIEIHFRRHRYDYHIYTQPHLMRGGGVTSDVGCASGSSEVIRNVDEYHTAHAVRSLHVIQISSSFDITPTVRRHDCRHTRAKLVDPVVLR